jgi:hypothetical protein
VSVNFSQINSILSLYISRFLKVISLSLAVSEYQEIIICLGTSMQQQHILASIPCTEA